MFQIDWKSMLIYYIFNNELFIYRKKITKIPAIAELFISRN